MSRTWSYCLRLLHTIIPMLAWRSYTFSPQVCIIFLRFPGAIKGTPHIVRHGNITYNSVATPQLTTLQLPVCWFAGLETCTTVYPSQHLESLFFFMRSSKQREGCLSRNAWECLGARHNLAAIHFSCALAPAYHALFLRNGILPKGSNYPAASSLAAEYYTLDIAGAKSITECQTKTALTGEPG